MPTSRDNQNSAVLERGRNNVASVFIKTTMGPAVKLM